MLNFIFGFLTAVAVMALYSVCSINSTNEQEREEKMMKECFESKRREK